MFGDSVDSIYLVKLKIKDITDTSRSVSYLYLHLEIDRENPLRTKLYDKRDNFNFPIVKFPFLCSNIPAAHVIKSIYLSVVTVFQSFCFLFGCPIWNHCFESFTIDIMTWLTVTKYQCNSWLILVKHCWPLIPSFHTISNIF